MNDTDFVENIGYLIENTKTKLTDSILSYVKQYIDAEKLFDSDKLIKIIDESNVVSRLVREHIEKWVATEIGNRLRCCIYDAYQVDKLFDSIWTKELDKAIEERIKRKVNASIDQIITEYLKKAMSK